MYSAEKLFEIGRLPGVFSAGVSAAPDENVMVGVTSRLYKISSDVVLIFIEAQPRNEESCMN